MSRIITKATTEHASILRAWLKHAVARFGARVNVRVSNWSIRVVLVNADARALHLVNEVLVGLGYQDVCGGTRFDWSGDPDRLSAFVYLTPETEG